MGRKIQLKRGDEANLPTLRLGEVGVTLDTKKLYFGTPTGNAKVPSAEEVEQVTQEVSKKADAEYVDTELAKKANATTVQGLSQTVNAKADVEYVETELAKKADTTALETKADVTALETKADKEEVNTLSTQLADTSKQATRTFFNDPSKDVIVSFMDDDGDRRLLSTIKPVFESEGVPCNICMITSTLNNPQYITAEEARELKRLGWTVASHTHNHINLQNTPLETVDMDLRTSKTILEENGLDHDILVYPYGAYSQATLDIVRKYFRMAITTPPNGYNVSPVDTFALKRIRGIGEEGETLDTIKATIDNAPAGAWIIIMSHTGYDAYADPANVEDLRSLIQYIKSKGIEIVNIEEGWRQKGNVVDAGTGYNNLRIGVDGQMRMNDVYEDYSFNNSTPITYFPYGKNVTYFNNNEIKGKGFPAGDNGGTVTTVRIRMNKYASEDASFQTFQPYYDNSLYRRRWVVSSSSWGPWEKIAQKIENVNYHVINTTLNAYTASQPIADYPNNTIVTFRVNVAGADGFPVTQAGTVTTYRLGGNGYDRQEFRTFDSDNIYIRRVKSSDGTWSEWELLNAYSIVKNVDVYTGNSIVTDFPPDKSTTFVSTVGTPNGVNGVFTTHRVRGAGYDYQTFKEYSLNDDFKMYIRNVKSGNVWGVWKQVQFIV